MENVIFKYALMISLAIHAFSGAVLLLTDIRIRKIAKADTMEIVYQARAEANSQEAVRPLQVERVSEERRPQELEPLPTRDMARMQPVPSLDKAPAHNVESPTKSVGPLFAQGEKRQIRVPMLDSDKMMGSRYVTYHEQVREKIRNRAYFYVDDPRFETGEVYLTFVLSSDGSLKAVQIIEDRTRANSYLRNVGMRSIRESSPFPQFPGDLSYPELSFNVVISFEMGP